ncbi:MAG: hypothetical protein ABI585_14720 [Betaproteobacteria bacterium]
MHATTARIALQRTTTTRVAALALAAALSAVTLAFAMPGGAAFVSGKLLPDAGNAFETIASTEVAILPGRIDVVGVRTQAVAAPLDAATRG